MGPLLRTVTHGPRMPSLTCSSMTTPLSDRGARGPCNNGLQRNSLRFYMSVSRWLSVLWSPVTASTRR